MREVFGVLSVGPAPAALFSLLRSRKPFSVSVALTTSSLPSSSQLQPRDIDREPDPPPQTPTTSPS